MMIEVEELDLAQEKALLTINIAEEGMQITQA